jgi:hypothetical protein
MANAPGVEREIRRRLPLMAAYAGLALEDFALEPFGKPYVFRKAGSQPAAALLDKRLMRELAERQLRIL